MKNPILLMFLMLVVIAGCASSLQKQSEDIAITYEAITRGSSLTVNAGKDSLTVKSVRGTINSKKEMQSSEWSSLIDELEKIDLDKINDLKAPSDKRFYDGALIASITVKLKDTTYHSSSFDHGNPPAEIATLVNRLISLSGADKKTTE